jgi:hypothetical protein
MKNITSLLSLLGLLLVVAGCRKKETDPGPDQGGIQVYQPIVQRAGNPNGDQTLNWGNQFNPNFGAFLDLIGGRTLQAAPAKTSPLSTDLIFVAPNDGQNAYYLLSPLTSKDQASNVFWGSNSTDNPVVSWTAVNESEVSPTNLSASQFEQVQTNADLARVLASVNGYAGFHSAGTRLEGQVFAARVKMNGRSLDGLIYVVAHFGTSGPNGYLKVKIKLTGIDTNNDGQADNDGYLTRR